MKPRVTLHHDRLEDDEFAMIAAILHGRAGIRLQPPQVAMLQSRLLRRVRQLRLETLAQYVAHVHSPAGAEELQRMVSTLTTHFTQFFREMHHFTTLRCDVLPPLIARAQAGDRVRIWSAGCSNGQEPFSIAMVIADLLPDFAAHDIRILATDIDPEMIAMGRAGIYPPETLESVPEPLRDRFIRPEPDGFRITRALRDLVTFRMHNLHEDWPMKGRFDVILCRNVVIYFDSADCTRLWRRLESRLAPGGWLFLGHSERIPRDQMGQLVSAGITVYRLPEDARIAAPAGTEN